MFYGGLVDTKLRVCHIVYYASQLIKYLVLAKMPAAPKEGLPHIRKVLILTYDSTFFFELHGPTLTPHADSSLRIHAKKTLSLVTSLKTGPSNH
jgi:hypothetical protein